MAKTVIAYILIGLVPLGLYVLQFFGFDFVPVDVVENTLVIPTFLGFGLVGFLGWRLNQSRILMVILMLIGAYYTVLNTELLIPTGIGRVRLRQILCFAFPVALIFVFFSKEARVLSKQSMRRIVLTLSPIVIMSAWFILWPFGFHQIASWTPIPLGEGFKIPQLSIVAVVILLVVFFRNKDKKIHPFMGATVISLIPFFTMVHIGLADEAKHRLVEHTIIAFSAICIILLSSIFLMYWQRVYMDELTDIPNRRALDESLATLEGVYCIAMIDIDHFKKFNDKYGHDEGDNVLRFVASVIETIEGGKAYRYGGEEFCAIFKNTTLKDAAGAADDIRKKLASRKFVIRSKKTTSKGRKEVSTSRKTAKVTISVGIAAPDRKNPTPDMVFKLSDKALYKAKDSGRNRVVVSE